MASSATTAGVVCIMQIVLTNDTSRWAIPVYSPQSFYHDRKNEMLVILEDVNEKLVRTEVGPLLLPLEEPPRRQYGGVASITREWDVGVRLHDAIDFGALGS